MRTFLVLTAATIVLSPIVFGSDCASAVDVRHRVHDGKVEFIAKNISGKPMVAYVIATDARDANGALINVFSGVFTDGDSLQPGKALAIGSTSATDSDLKPRVDYAISGWLVVRRSFDRTGKSCHFAFSEVILSYPAGERTTG